MYMCCSGTPTLGGKLDNLASRTTNVHTRQTLMHKGKGEHHIHGAMSFLLGTKVSTAFPMLTLPDDREHGSFRTSLW